MRDLEITPDALVAVTGGRVVWTGRRADFIGTARDEIDAGGCAVVPGLVDPHTHVVWGGDRLARFAKAIRPGERIGESWEVADLDSTSASGAGGAPARSIIDNGPLAGATIRSAIETCEVVYEGTHIRITASLGVSVTTPDKPMVDGPSLVAAADAALYRAKNQGRNQVAGAD